MKPDDDEDKYSFKAQKLKDLLNTCSHYNVQARKDALSNLKDLFQKQPEVLKDNLNAVLQRILGLATDLESSVRKTFLMLISLICKSISETDISPFFGSIVAYLCSAMTHLNEGIRLDSMKFLDLCLEHFPQLVKANPKNILLNFMNVISVEKSNVAKSSGIYIKTELKAKVTSQKTQLQVLSRLNCLLGVVFGDACRSNSIAESNLFNLSSASDKFDLQTQCTNNIQSNNFHDINDGQNPHSDAKSTTIDDTSNINRFSSFSNPYSILVSNFTLETATSELEMLRSNEKWLRELITSLLPVLLEYWVECSPVEFSMNLIPIKKRSFSLQIMKEILEIFVTLVKSLEDATDQSQFLEFLNGNLLAQVNTHFVKVFPFRFTLQQSGKQSKVESIETVTDLGLNILIAQLLSYYIPDLKDDVNNLPRWASEVLAYLQNVLSANTPNKLTATDIMSITQLVQSFLLNLPEEFENEKAHLLESIFKMFENSRPTSNAKKISLDFLVKIVNSRRNYGGKIFAVLDNWLKSLLKLLGKDVSQDLKCEILFICKSGIVQGFPNLTNAVVKELPRFFAVENFSKLSENVQRLVIEILYHCGQIPSCQLYGVLATLSNYGNLSLPIFKYLLFVVHQLVHSNSVISAIGDYLSFILSIAIGHTEDKLDCVQACEKQQPNSYNFKEVSEPHRIVAEFGNSNTNSPITIESWAHANEVIEIVCQVLAQSDYSLRLLEMLKVPLCKLFSKYATLPLEVVYRLLYLVKTLLHLAKNMDAPDCADVLAIIGTWCVVLHYFLLRIAAEFGSVNIIQMLNNHLKAIISDLCKSSEIILKVMLEVFLQCTLCDFKLACQVLCQVLTDVRASITVVHLPILENLCKKMESAFDKGVLDNQTFIDFKHQYQHCVRKCVV